MNKSKELINTTKLVKYILEQYPGARNSDNILYCYVLMVLGRRTGQNYENIPVTQILLNMKEYGLPSIETVGRCRRKIVNQHPELAGNSEVEAQRAMNELTFRQYARQVTV